MPKVTKHQTINFFEPIPKNHVPTIDQEVEHSPFGKIVPGSAAFNRAAQDAMKPIKHSGDADLLKDAACPADARPAQRILGHGKDDLDVVLILGRMGFSPRMKKPLAQAFHGLGGRMDDPRTPRFRGRTGHSWKALS